VADDTHSRGRDGRAAELDRRPRLLSLTLTHDRPLALTDRTNRSLWWHGRNSDRKPFLAQGLLQKARTHACRS
jgi:hypothetical protein